MAEDKDIDALLDQVEVKFLTKREKYDSSRTVPPLSEASNCPCTVKGNPKWSEVDELLKDFQLDDRSGDQRASVTVQAYCQGSKGKDNDPPPRDLRCAPLYLAGSYEPLGYSAPGFEKCCNRLGCLQCDFDIEVFDNFAWDSSTDYLFLRTNMPAFDKVAQKLVKRKGTRAYACQCQHVSVTKWTNVGSLPHLKWICKKHSVN